MAQYCKINVANRGYDEIEENMDEYNRIKEGKPVDEDLGPALDYRESIEGYAEK